MWFVEWWKFMFSSFWVWLGSAVLLVYIFPGFVIRVVKK